MSQFDRDWADSQRHRLQDELDNVHRNQRWAGWALMFVACTVFWFVLLWEITS